MIRTHVRPRRALFTPEGTKNNPAGDRIRGERITVRRGEITRDDWRASEDPHALLGHEKWRGCTIFFANRPGNLWFEEWLLGKRSAVSQRIADIVSEACGGDPRVPPPPESSTDATAKVPQTIPVHPGKTRQPPKSEAVSSAGDEGDRRALIQERFREALRKRRKHGPAPPPLASRSQSSECG